MRQMDFGPVHRAALQIFTLLWKFDYQSLHRITVTDLPSSWTRSIVSVCHGHTRNSDAGLLQTKLCNVIECQTMEMECNKKAHNGNWICREKNERIHKWQGQRVWLRIVYRMIPNIRIITRSQTIIWHSWKPHSWKLMEISQQTTAQISMMRRERENHTVTGALRHTHTHTNGIKSTTSQWRFPV